MNSVLQYKRNVVDKVHNIVKANLKKKTLFILKIIVITKQSYFETVLHRNMGLPSFLLMTFFSQISLKNIKELNKILKIIDYFKKIKYVVKCLFLI